jgi:hypothetical protein
MRKASVLVSDITSDNDFQLGQAMAAEDAAARMGMNISIGFADNDAVNQSQQLLNAVLPGFRGDWRSQRSGRNRRKTI